MKPLDEVMPVKSGKKKKTLPDFSSWVQTLFQANEENETSKLMKPEGGLYLVATPIGNLGDMTLRGLWLLQKADLILCEDTRVTGNLLRQYGIHRPLLSCHDHNEATRIAQVLARIKQDEVIVLVSDAGTPMISDPGYRLAVACRAEGYPVVAAPGASALLTALSCAGLPSDRFLFIGFLPTKSKARQVELAKVSALKATLIFYEAPTRLDSTLADMAQALSPTRACAVCRELTKLYEEVQTGTILELAAHYKESEKPKGEIVILVGPDETPEQETSDQDLEELLSEALTKMSLRDAVAAVTEATGLKKSIVYQRAIKLQD